MNNATIVPSSKWIRPAGTDGLVHFDPEQQDLPEPSFEEEDYEVHFFRHALGFVKKHRAKSDPFVCVMDHERRFDEVAVRVLRGQLAELVRSVGKKWPRRRVLLTGSWRVFEANISALDRNVAVAAVPPHLGQVFGVPFAYGRWGVDVYYAVVEYLVCRGAAQRARLVDLGKHWKLLPRKALFLEIMRHIPLAVLDEDLGVLQQHPGVLEALQQRRHLAAVEPVVDNGSSNVEGAMQSLVYVANVTDSACFLLPLSSTNGTYAPAAWGSAVDLERLYATFPFVMPPSLLPILYPSSTIMEYFDGRQVPVLSKFQISEADMEYVTEKHKSVLSHLQDFLGQYWSSRSGYFKSPRRLFIDHEEGESLKMHGNFAVQPAHPSGLSDGEIDEAFRIFAPDTTLFLDMSAQRVDFHTSNHRHKLFFKLWRKGFVWSAANGDAQS